MNASSPLSSMEVMVLDCLSQCGIGPRVQMKAMMDKYMYKNILENVMEPFADVTCPLKRAFQHDNHPNHTSKFINDFNTNQLMLSPGQFDPQITIPLGCCGLM